MIKKRSHLCSVFIFLMLFALCGCIGGTSPKSVYYVFNPSQEVPETLPTFDKYGLGVGPINLPGFLKRPHIVTRKESNVLVINEFHRWGDSLGNQMTAVLVENISSFLNTSRVSAYPWEKTFSPAYQLFVDFRQFDGKINDSVVLEAIWWIVDIKNDKRLITKRTSIVEPVDNSEYKTYVTALNTALDKLSQQVAADIISALP